MLEVVWRGALGDVYRQAVALGPTLSGSGGLCRVQLGPQNAVLRACLWEDLANNRLHQVSSVFHELLFTSTLTQRGGPTHSTLHGLGDWGAEKPRILGRAQGEPWRHISNPGHPTSEATGLRSACHCASLSRVHIAGSSATSKSLF